MIGALKQLEAGRKAEDVAREVGVSKHTIYAWKAKYGGMDVSQAQEAKQLRDENTRLRKLVASVSGGRVDDPEEEAETLRPRGTTVASLDGGEPGMGAGLSARCGGVRTGDPGAERGGCVHARVFGLGSGHEFRQPESDASTGRDRGRTRTAESNSLRQRARADEPAFSGVVRGTAD